MATREAQNDIFTWKPIYLEGAKTINVMGVMKMNKDGIAWRSKAGQGVTVVGTDVRSGEWRRVSRLFQLRLFVKGGVSYKFDGFKEQDDDFMKEFFQKHFKITLSDGQLSTKGWNWGQTSFDDNHSNVSFKVDDEVAFDLPLSEVLQCIPASKKSHEAVMKFHQDDTAAQANTESLVEMKFFFPPTGADKDGSDDDEDKKKKDLAGIFISNVLKGADTTSASGKGILSFEQVPILVPRGRYDIEMFGSFLEMHGKSFDYKIKYTSIVRLFQLPRPDRASVVFVVSLDPPIRQGQTVYPHVVMQIEEKSECTPSPNIPDELKNDPRMKQIATMKTDTVYTNLAKAFRYLTGKKITPPRTFKTSGGQRGLKCSLRANEGYLFPLEKDFFFIHKPPTHIRHEEIESVEFLRMNDTTNRTFDIQFNLESGNNLAFKSITRDDYSPLFNFLVTKDIKIENYDGVCILSRASLTAQADISSIVIAETDKEGKEERKAKRGTNTEVRLKVARAMAAEEIESDESDVDFGNKDEESEDGSEDDEVDSEEIDSASDEIIEASKTKEKKERAEEEEKGKKRKREDNEGNESGGEQPKKKRKEEKVEEEEGEISAESS